MDTSNQDSESADSSMFISTASRPIPLNEWSNSKDLFEHPSPIGKELTMISKLFRPEWLSPSREYGIDPHLKLNAKGMRKLFEDGMSSYCKLMLDIECSKLKGTSGPNLFGYVL